MHSIVHLAIGILVAYLLHLPLEWFIVFVVASVAIDLDHFLEFKGSKIKKDALLDPVVYSRSINYRSLQKSIHIFHTFEVLLIIFLSFALHLLLDIFGDIWNRNIFHHGKEGWLKYWFLTYYIRKQDVYNRENLTI